MERVEQLGVLNYKVLAVRGQRRQWLATSKWRKLEHLTPNILTCMNGDELPSRHPLLRERLSAETRTVVDLGRHPLQMRQSSCTIPPPLKSRLHHFRQRRLLALSAVAASLPPPHPSPHPTVPLRFRPLLQLPHFGPPVANTTLPSNVNCFSRITFTFIWRGLPIPIPNVVCFPPILS